MKPCNHDSRPLFELLIEPLRERARELGYALAVHGSLKRDIDLIACPWTSDAVDAAALAEALMIVAGEVTGAAFMTPAETSLYFRVGVLGAKPHGRLAWSFHLGGGPYIDLSVMPRTDPAHQGWFIKDEEAGLFASLDGLPDRVFPQVGKTHHFREAADAQITERPKENA